MAISGKEFKERYNDTKFYKLTNEEELHKNFQFKDAETSSA